MTSTCTPADSVLELKRGLKDQQQNNSSPLTTSTSDDDSGSSRGSSSGDMGSTNREEDVNHEYQTMDRVTYEPPATSSTFRPPNQSTTSNNSSTPLGTRSSTINSGR